MEILIFSVDDEIVDIEWFVTNGHIIPKGRKYRIIVDDEKYVVHKECLTGREILEVSHHTPPEKYILRLKHRHGKKETIALTQEVCFHGHHQIDRFETLPNDHTDGTEVEILRKQFTLLPEDEEFANSLGLPWETIQHGGAQWLLIHDYAIPDGYNVKKAILATRIVPGYPTTQLDMLYFYPALNRLDGRPIKQLSLLNLDNKSFQQWSRHRTAANPWKPGVDNLSTHVPLADGWLNREFNT